MRYFWTFSTDTPDVKRMAALMRKAGAQFNPEKQQTGISGEPGGYATAEEGDYIIESFKEILEERGTDTKSLPSWEELTPAQKQTTLEHAAATLSYIEDGLFEIEHAEDHGITHILTEAAKPNPGES